MAEDTIPSWSETDLDEKEKFDREKKGLIGDLAKQREKNRALEERLAAIEQSLSAPDPEPALPVDARIQKFTQDPDAYIKDVVSPILSEQLEPLQKVLSQSQVEKKLDRAMEDIADKEGISKKEAQKRYD